MIPSTFTSLADILIRNLSVTLSTELIWSVNQKVGTRTPFKLNGTTLGGGGEILKSHYLLSVTTVFCPSTIKTSDALIFGKSLSNMNKAFEHLLCPIPHRKLGGGEYLYQIPIRTYCPIEVLFSPPILVMLLS